MTKKSFYLLAFIVFLSMTGYGIVLPALPYLAEDIGLSSFQMGSLITGWAFAQFIVVPFWGRIIDLIGRKPILIFGLFGFGIAFSLLLFAHTYSQLLLIRIIGAILSTGMLPASYAMVIDYCGKEKRGPALAKLAAANALGFLCGPVVGGIFSPIGVSVPFMIAGLLSFASIPLAWIFLKEPIEKHSEKNVLSFKSSLRIMFHRGYRELFIITFGLAVAASSVFSMLGYFMIDRFNSTASETGIAFSTQSMAAVVIQMFIMGFIYRKFKEEGIAKIGLILETFGYSFIAFSFQLWMIFIGCAFIGAGQALARPTLLAILSRQEKMGKGMVMGLQQSMDSFGRSVGPLLAGWLFTFGSSAPFISSLSICFTLFLFFFYLGARQQNNIEYQNSGGKDGYFVK
ncbi:MFS transporter [Parageobacillus thermoglucosidasius]|uniref:Major facilitator superfamily (MFS) profile domain-containing protein n=1 Tax=Parageobacillus thermoglucosidasius TaxID=1426 RepID=A0AAN0YQD7_PARTM|nr:MFS transporter [Parageobacillus thermoglucosidasius]ALF11098.1 hypothetical protein AOT13_14355 [Parageobacillus thermoglucosidasius]ANZ31176.1 hypothetical protein BCV53_14380 [Parageobacillus thermoglucosidasius]APM81913.1 hypothetical protein BCV54_14390 [Parageobacillus thermoglucosidasius]KJX68859.1 hypothetical protein WH82_10485 [Parageobacillus thermoglucosidasius]RDE25653.1 MFS transporter [Parageobacillus thermoglucosidasius]